MACEFSSVFHHVGFHAADLLVTPTARTFTKQDPGDPVDNPRWVSNEAPQGACGVSEITTLQDDGTVKWTMEARKLVTRKDADPLCRDVDERPETLSWQNLRRPLPCAFIQPGGITR